MAIGAILGGISAAAGLFGSFSSASNAKSNAAAQRRAQRKAQKIAEERAEKINEYNMERFENEKDNFSANRQFNYEQAMRQYDYAVRQQKLEYDTQMRAYNKDQQNLANQLAFNRIGSRQAYMREQNVMRDITAEQTYERQEAYIEGMKSRAAAAASPAGASGDRAVQMALAEAGRKLAVMDASFTGQVREHNANMFDIAMRKTGADMNARAQTMLEPSKPIDLVRPEITPLPKFTEPLEVEPEFVSQYVPQPDTFGTIVGGIGNAVSSLSSIDFTNPNKFTPAPNKGSGTKIPQNQFSGNPFSPR